MSLLCNRDNYDPQLAPSQATLCLWSDQAWQRSQAWLPRCDVTVRVLLCVQSVKLQVIERTRKMIIFLLGCDIGADKGYEYCFEPITKEKPDIM